MTRRLLAACLLLAAAGAAAQGPGAPPDVAASSPTLQLPGVGPLPAQPPAAPAAPATPAAPGGYVPTPLPAFRAPAAPAQAPIEHPLDPLSSKELIQASALLRMDTRFPEGSLFAALQLNEPTKFDFQDWAVYGSTPDRKAFAVLLQREQNATYEAVINLTRGKVESVARKPGVQPGFLGDETSLAASIVRRDPGWQAAMRRRGISEFSAVHLDAWAPGTVGLSGAAGPRLARVLSFYKGKSSNDYARPVEGLVAIVDMTSRSVMRLDETGEIDLSQEDGAFDDKSVSQPALGPKPLQPQQPEGQTFEVRGWQVRWLNWTFRFALHPREGPVLYEVAFKDGAGPRRILQRASLSEMFVAYGDPAAAWSWRSTLDVGEYGLGRLATPLEAGTDVPEAATAIDASLIDDYGKVYSIKRALALYERDGGLLWRHYSSESGSTESRRARELVLGSIATVGNQDYGLNWVFHQDGSLEFQAELTGALLAKGILPETEAEEDRYSQRLSTRVGAPGSQHFFNLRLDFDVDGQDNALYEAAAAPAPYSAMNPTGNAFRLELRPLKNEKDARRAVDAAESRRWLVATAASAKEGRPAGYMVVPGENAFPLADAGSEARRRAAFVDHHLWATRYKPEELYASGPYPNQSRGGDGLPKYSDGDSLDGKDLVVWYTFGVTDLPRAEQWPVLSVRRAGVKLVPSGFFRQNPALGTPRPKR